MKSIKAIFFIAKSKKIELLSVPFIGMVKVLFFVFLFSFSKSLVAQNNFEGIYIDKKVVIEGEQYIYQKETKAPKQGIIYVIENTFIKGLNINSNIKIVYLKKNKLEVIAIKEVSKKPIKCSKPFENQISYMPFGNLPFKNKKSFSFYVNILIPSTHKKQIFTKTALITYPLIYYYTDIIILNEAIAYSCCQSLNYNEQTLNQNVTRPPPIV